ncbi:MAG: DnaB-like helicase C-terminal domain-containing protein [Planctomycetota bacterium]
MNPNSEVLDQLPPNDTEAEGKLLGALLLDPRRLEEISLEPNEFYGGLHANVFRVIQRVYMARPDSDAAHAVAQALQSDEKLWKELGNGALFVEWVQRATVTKAPYYAGRIHKAAQHRTMIQAANAMLQRAYDMEEDQGDLLSDCERILSTLSTGSASTDPAAIADAVMESMQMIEDICTRKDRAGILTGMYAYDRDLGGLHPGELTTLAARPGQGKSATMGQWAFHVAESGKRVYMASIEMSRTDLATRQLCAVSGVSNQKIRTGSIDQSDIGLLVDAAEIVSRGNLVIHDYPRLNPFEIRRAARREKAEIIFIDYLQLVQSPDRNKKRHEQVGEICKDLRAIARELKIPMVVAAQLNRSADMPGKDPRPRLSQLKESGSIEEDSDCVLLLYRPEEKIVGKDKFAGQTWDAELKVAKNRKGCTPRFRMTWDAARTQFSIYEPERTASRDPSFDQGNF